MLSDPITLDIHYKEHFKDIRNYFKLDRWMYFLENIKLIAENDCEKIMENITKDLWDHPSLNR